MTSPALEILSDRITEAHTRIQKDFADINPVVSVSRKMRDLGIPADTMTVECLKTKRRILIILHDKQPGLVSYQFGMKDEDPSDEFKGLSLNNLSVDLLYSWMAEYFSVK